METRSYRFGDLREKLRESVSESKPKFGDGVEDAEKAQNKEAYRKMKEEAEEYNKGIESPGGKNTTKSLHAEANKGMSDLQYDSPKPEGFDENVEAQMGGFINASDKKNHEKEPLGNASRNPKLAKELVAHAKEVEDATNKLSNSGKMTGGIDKERHDSVVGESKKTSLLKFKHVQFISENHMLSHVPDEYKVEGKKFYMQDCKGNKYLVEWHSEPGVEKQLNENVVNAEMDRIKELFNYSGKNSKTTNSVRMNENKGVEDMLGRVRTLMK